MQNDGNTQGLNIGIIGHLDIPDRSLLQKHLVAELKNLADNYGKLTVITGGSMGYDLLAYYSSYALKVKGYNIDNVIIKPYPQQDYNYTWRYKKQLKFAEKHSREVITLFDSGLNNAIKKQRERFEYIIDNCDILISFLDRHRGDSGTYHSVTYAMRDRKPLILFFPEKEYGRFCGVYREEYAVSDYI